MIISFLLVGSTLFCITYNGKGVFETSSPLDTKSSFHCSFISLRTINTVTSISQLGGWAMIKNNFPLDVMQNSMMYGNPNSGQNIQSTVKRVNLY